MIRHLLLSLQGPVGPPGPDGERGLDGAKVLSFAGGCCKYLVQLTRESSMLTGDDALPLLSNWPLLCQRAIM